MHTGSSHYGSSYMDVDCCTSSRCFASRILSFPALETSLKLARRREKLPPRLIEKGSYESWKLCSNFLLKGWIRNKLKVQVPEWLEMAQSVQIFLAINPRNSESSPVELHKKRSSNHLSVRQWRLLVSRVSPAWQSLNRNSMESGLQAFTLQHDLRGACLARSKYQA